MPNTWDGVGEGINEGLGYLAQGLKSHWEKQKQKETLNKQMSGAESVYQKTTDLINQILLKNEQASQPPPPEPKPLEKSEIDFTGEMPTRISVNPMTVGDEKGGIQMQSQKMSMNELFDMYHKADAKLRLEYGEAGTVYSKYLADNFDRALNNPDEKIYTINGKMIKVNQRTGKYQMIFDGSKPLKEEPASFGQYREMSYDDIISQLTPKQIEDNIASFSDEALQELFNNDPELKVVYDKKYKEKPVVKTGRVRVGTTKVEPLSEAEKQFNDGLKKVADTNAKVNTMKPEEKAQWDKNKKEFATQYGLSVKELEAFSKKYMNAKGSREVEEITDEVEEAKTENTASVEKVAKKIEMQKWTDKAYMIDTSTEAGIKNLQTMIDALWDTLGAEYNSIDEGDQPYMYSYIIETYVNPVLSSKGIPPITLK